MDKEKKAKKYNVVLDDEKIFSSFDEKLMAVELAVHLAKFPNNLTVSVVSDDGEKILQL